ncbi:NUDIX hydrolase domain-like protein [Daldinia decipiens]|uniref:NUDIX hydrolase domain-like protein n=1 Tax=Daldinia decipiens TaxID=326647 RepID=UPI0020C27B69|nr:NUDIX hydrolase domain-like protein [Daldinia decipiens]KAI1660265.1 NUDIX hydrolase domain-like protein [Daldinia decipiens]
MSATNGISGTAKRDDSPPLTELETAEILQSIRNSTTRPPTSLPADLALSLDLHRQHHHQHQHQQPPSEPPDLASYYWDASTMAPLNKISAAALARLRAYKPPPFPTWDHLPVSRRAAVLILLFADRRGDLRVVITMRATSLRNFSGHAAFPGGKADSLSETPYQIARREAWEEIGLPMDDARIPKPFRIEPLCCLPCSLAKTEMAVRPCVAFLHADDVPGKPITMVDESMMPRLDAKEVAAVFSGPFHNFLKAKDEPHEGETIPPGDWYDGYWHHWHDKPWRVHNFHVPVNNQKVTKPKVRDGGQAVLADVLEEEEDALQRFLVWGLTARMLVDAARIAYEEEPEFEHNSHYGDEEIIAILNDAGRLPDKKRKEVGQEAIKDEVKDAKM